MTTMQKQKGFTLVELAIVLVIVGLLIGGILKGQELMQNARVTATVAQLKSMEAAVTNFYDVYKEKPGDLLSPDTRIKGCANCVLETPANTEFGNGKIGKVGWDFQNQLSAVDTGVFPTGEEANAESVLFWYELLMSGLISGVTDEAISGANAATDLSLGGAIPEMKVGGGLWAGNSNGTGPDATELGKADYGVRGTVLVTVTKATQDPSRTTGTQPFYPKDAANIDRKLDDGLPNTGVIEAYGETYAAATGGCISAITDSGIYSENVNSKDCGLVIRIFK